MLMLNANAITLTGPVDEQRWAQELFEASNATGKLRRMWRGLRGRGMQLRSLDATAQQGGRALGRMTVAIDAIVGSEGRSRDFDSAFAPLNERTRDRWASIAQARHNGRVLPPVLLIRAADGYYVRDGHHRISVARALGAEFVEAEVISWI